MVIVITGATGSGKTTLGNCLYESVPYTRNSVSTTTRTKGKGEIEGFDYFFVDRPEFERMVADGEMVEHVEYDGNLYGTSKAALTSAGSAPDTVAVVVCEINGAKMLGPFLRSQGIPCICVYMHCRQVELVRRITERGRTEIAGDSLSHARLTDIYDDHSAHFGYLNRNSGRRRSYHKVISVDSGKITPEQYPTVTIPNLLECLAKAGQGSIPQQTIEEVQYAN